MNLGPDFTENDKPICFFEWISSHTKSTIEKLTLKLWKQRVFQAKHGRSYEREKKFIR